MSNCPNSQETQSGPFLSQVSVQQLALLWSLTYLEAPLHLVLLPTALTFTVCVPQDVPTTPSRQTILPLHRTLLTGDSSAPHPQCPHATSQVQHSSQMEHPGGPKLAPAHFSQASLGEDPTLSTPPSPGKHLWQLCWPSSALPEHHLTALRHHQNNNQTDPSLHSPAELHRKLQHRGLSPSALLCPPRQKWTS